MRARWLVSESSGSTAVVFQVVLKPPAQDLHIELEQVFRRRNLANALREHARNLTRRPDPEAKAVAVVVEALGVFLRMQETLGYTPSFGQVCQGGVDPTELSFPLLLLRDGAGELSSAAVTDPALRAVGEDPDYPWALMGQRKKFPWEKKTAITGQ